MQITGYRALSKEEIDELNEIKKVSVEVGQLIEDLKIKNPNLDMRWANIATTQLQQGFMALTRAVARPTTF